MNDNNVNIYETLSKSVFDSWISDIRKSSLSLVKGSIIIPEKLIVFAWKYASIQTYELKDRFGGSIHFINSVESIFINKLSELAYVIGLGYTETQILTGKSPVVLDPGSKDERVVIDSKYICANKEIFCISGSKKYTYPTVSKHLTTNQMIVYIDAIRISSFKRDYAHINFVDNKIKATVLGIADKNDIPSSIDQSKYLGYSNIYSSFVKFDRLLDIPAIIKKTHNQTIPEFVNYVYKMKRDDVDSTMIEIKNSLNFAIENNSVSIIDYSKLFDPILKS